jgi:MEMO1 family protein
MHDYANSVGYLAGAFTGKWGDTAALPPVKQHPGVLTDDEKKQLVRLARATLRSHVLSDDSLSKFLTTMKSTEGMTGISGAFVTYKIHDDLRGCIGSIEGREPLWLAVVHNACNAASEDPRFNAVGPLEVDAIHLEVSVLTPLKPAASYKEIKLGVHGVVLEKGGRGAVFLPQVATETGWTLDEFLSHLSQKAGLSADAWKQGATFKLFEAIVIEE